MCVVLIVIVVCSRHGREFTGVLLSPESVVSPCNLIKFSLYHMNVSALIKGQVIVKVIEQVTLAFAFPIARI